MSKQFKQPKDEKKRNSNGSKGGKEYTKGSGNNNKPDKRPNQDEALKGDKPIYTEQDPFWYASSDAEINQIANFPWLSVAGSSFVEVGKDKLPTAIMASYKPSLGSDDPTRGAGANYITRSATAYYQSLVQGYTGTVPFESPDLMLCTIAGAQVFAFVEIARRAIGLADYYIVNNKSYARYVVEAFGFDFDSITKSKADFVSELNIRIRQINGMVCVPKEFNLLKRWVYINSHAFVDIQEANYAIPYGFKPEQTFKYNPTALTTGTSLTTLDVKKKLTADEYFAILDELINALDDDDTREMFGSTRRVYDAPSLYRCEEVVEDYQTQLTTNDVVAAMFHNMKTVPGVEFYGLETTSSEWKPGIWHIRMP